MQKYAIRKDDYLRPENKRLRDTIERMQSERTREDRQKTGRPAGA